MKEEKEHHCSCGHSHEHEILISPLKKKVISIVFVVVSLIVLKPFLFNQIFSRASAYLSYPLLYDDAIRQYKKCVFLDKESDGAWDLLGHAYKAKGDTKKSIETYETAIKIDPNNRKAHFDLGMVYALNKDFRKAAEHFKYIAAMGKENEDRASVDLISYHHSSCQMLIICFEKLGDTVELKHAIDMTLKFYPDDKKAKDALSKIKGI